MSNSVIRDLKQQLADRLLANSYFANIPVMVVIPKDILNSIQKGTAVLNGGIGVFIGASTLRNQNPNTPGPVFDDGSVIVELLQSPTLTPASVTADIDEAGETAMRLLHLFAPYGDNVVTVSDWAEVEDAVYSRRLFKVNGLVALLPIALPAIAAVVPSTTTPGNQTVTLTCATAGAAIFYNVGATGSVPYAAPATSTLYTGPISVTAGQQLRARPWLAGYAASNPPDLTVQY